MTLTEILDELNIPYKRAGESPHVRGEWVGIECVYCGYRGSGNYSLGISPVGAVKCWKCGRHRLGETLAEAGQVSLASTLQLLKRWLRPETLTPFPKTQGQLVLPKGLEPLYPIHRRYLEGRGFDPDTLVKSWGLLGIGLAARLPWRIFIPIHHQARIVSWTTRSLTDCDRRRYIGASTTEEIMPAKELLYGEDLALHAIVVVEGPADAWRIGPGAVATLGVGYTQAQLLRISRFPVRVICFDNEAEAQRRARALGEALAAYPGRTIRCQLAASDPGSAQEKEVRRLRKTYLD